MKLYANINKHSKYFASQSAKEPFPVSYIQTSDLYCWTGNANSYQTSDLDFYVKEGETFFPSGILSFGTPFLFRALQCYLTDTKELSVSNSLYDRDMLFEMSNSEVISTMKEIIDFLPESRPKCETCGKTIMYCTCIQ